MGGKTKQSQRTKNNVKPSSSARSAEILGNSLPNFVGFSAVKDGTFVPFLPGFNVPTNDTIEANLGTEFQLTLKKLGKKDSTTKLKALQEFSVLIENSTLEEVNNALPLWPRLYTTLATDIEHKVREAAQIAHGVVVKKCGRSIAPYIKQIAPAWITSQYDNFAPAATQAQLSLQTIFPEKKLPDVLSFCKNELMTYIHENLLLHTANTIANPKSSTPDAAEMKYQRLVIASLQGYALILKHLPESDIGWMCEEQSKILESNKFWKYASNKTENIRSSWFALIGQFCTRIPVWFGEKYGAKTAKILIANLNEKKSGIAISIWDSFVLFIAQIKDCGITDDMSNDLKKKMFEALKFGGWGIASQLSTLLLPIIAHLPTDLLTSQFYSEFFTSLLIGLEEKNILSSKSERQAWIAGIVECVRYVSRNNIDTFACQVLPPQMRCLLLQILDLPNGIAKSSIIKYTGQQLSCVLSYWIKQSAETKQHNYDVLIRVFWQNTNVTLVSPLSLLLEAGEPNIEKLKDITDNQLQLIIALKNGSIAETKKRAKVQFDEPDSLSKNVAAPTNIVDKTCADRYTHNLNQLVYEICAQYLQFASAKEVSAPILEPLCTLMCEFNSKELFVGISRKVFESGRDCSIVTLYNELWLRWLTSDSMRSRAVVELTFILLLHLEVEEQEQVLRSFHQFVPSVVEMCISKCVSHPYSSHQFVKRWMQSELVTHTLTRVCNRLVNEGDTRSKTLLNMCFSLDIDGNTMISSSATSCIVRALAHALRADCAQLDLCASFASQLVTTVSGIQQFNFQHLLVEMVRLNCTVKPGDNISSDTWWEVKTSWQDAISTLDTETRDSFIKESAALLYNAAINEEADSEKIDLLVGLAAGVSSGLVSHGNSMNENTLIVASMTETFLASPDMNEKFEYEKLYKSALKSHILRGELNCPLPDGNKALESIVNESSETRCEELSAGSAEAFLSWYLWVAKYLRTVLSRSEIMDPRSAYKDLDIHSDISEREDDEIRVENDAWISGLCAHQHVSEQVATLLHNLMILKSLYSSWTFSEHYNKLSKYTELETLVGNILKVVPDNFVQALYNKACSEGYFWSIAYQYYSNFKDVEHKADLKDDDNIFLSGTGYFHNLQAYALTKVNKEVDLDRAFITNSKLALRCFHIANCSETSEDRVEITEEDIKKCISDKYGCITLILTKYYANNNIMLYERDVSTASWAAVVSNAVTVRLLSAAVSHGGWDLQDLHWDFITITLSSLFCSVHKSLHHRNWNSTKVVMVLNALVELYSVVSEFVSSVPRRSVHQQPGRAVSGLAQEWRDIFAPDLHTNIFNIVSHVFADGINATDKLDQNSVIFLSSLDRVMKLCDYSHIPAALRSGQLGLDAILKHCLQTLNAPCSHVWKYCSFTIVNQIIPNLVQIDDDNLSLVAGSDTETVMPKLTLHKLEWVLNNLQENVDAILDTYVMLEDSCELIPFTDSYNIVLGYLLLWELTFKVHETAKGDLHNQFVHMLRNSEHFDVLLTNMVKLMPPSVTQQVPGKHSVCTQALEHFQAMPTLNSQVVASAGLIGWLACHVWSLGVCSGGVASRVRGWWAGLEARASRRVETLVTDYVSAALVRRQLQHVLTNQNLLEDVQINVHYPNSEIVCTHEVDGRNLVLTIQLPKNHPLGTPKIDITGSPVNSTQGIAFLFTYQNGSLWLAIEIWLSSLQRKLRLVPVCYVCYCRLHHASGTLPNVHCNTCNNKFHNPCIFKWFATSGKSTCPLCRSSF